MSDSLLTRTFYLLAADFIIVLAGLIAIVVEVHQIYGVVASAEEEAAASPFAYTNLHEFCRDRGANMAMGYRQPYPWSVEVFCFSEKDGTTLVSATERGVVKDHPLTTAYKNEPFTVMRLNGTVEFPYLSDNRVVFSATAPKTTYTCADGSRALAVDAVEVAEFPGGVGISRGNPYCLENGVLILRDGANGNTIVEWDNFVPLIEH